MLKNLVLCLLACFMLTSCVRQNQTAKLVEKIRYEMKNKYSIKDGEVIAKFDLEGMSKKSTNLFAPYYASVINNSDLNKKFLNDFEKNYRHKNFLQSIAYKKLNLLNGVLLSIDEKYKLFSQSTKHKLKRIALQFKKYPSLKSGDKQNYVNILASLHNSTKNIPLFVPIESARVTSKFGKRQHPHKKKPIHHSGLDMVGSINCGIYAAADGIVEVVARAQGYGNMVIIKHDKDIRTRYAHLNKIAVYEGDKILLGQKVGTQGCSGTATGAHLHLEVILRNQAVDPMPFLGHSL